MEGLKPYGIDSGMYRPEVTERRRHQIQEINRMAIIEAAKACSQIVTSVGKSKSIPLVGLDLNNQKLVEVNWEFELEIGEKATRVHIHQGHNISPAFISYTYPKEEQEDPFILGINSDLSVLPGFQGYGFGIGLFSAEDYMLRKAMKLLGYDKTMCHIYALLFDDTAKRMQYHKREGWSLAASILHAGYINDFDLLVRYLGKDEALEYPSRMAIKVYQDFSRGISI